MNVSIRKFFSEVTRLQLMLITALWLSLLPNIATLRAFANSPSAGDGALAAAFTFGGWLFTYFICFWLITAFACVFWGRSLRYACMLLLVLGATFGYFSFFLGTLFDKTMFMNMIQTDTHETIELINVKLLVWIAVLGVLPAIWVWRVKILPAKNLARAALVPFATLLLLILVTGAIVFAMFPRYASATRNRSISFDTITPANVFAASVHYAASLYAANTVREPRGLDAHQAYALAKPRLVVFVLGETARAQSFGLNGYERDTTPRMRALGVQYFPDTESCGTATGISVPCIFSGFGRESFNLKKGLGSETLIDVVFRGGARVIWRDNDSGCKGICDKADVSDITASNDARWCTESANCFDEMLLDGLEQKLRGANKDTFLVLHLKGSHGPAYYKRYPPAFEKFKPTCQTSDLSACEPQSVRNGYDNSILYTDHVLGEIHGVLQRVSDQYATAMLYASDHGESIGESGLFLHGMPYALAPKEQTRVPMLTWVSPELMTLEGMDAKCMAERTKVPRSHDNIYSTVLGFLKIETVEYKKELDLYGGCGKR